MPDFGVAILAVPVIGDTKMPSVIEILDQSLQGFRMRQSRAGCVARERVDRERDVWPRQHVDVEDATQNRQVVEVLLGELRLADLGEAFGAHRCNNACASVGAVEAHAHVELFDGGRLGQLEGAFFAIALNLHGQNPVKFPGLRRVDRKSVAEELDKPLVNVLVRRRDGQIVDVSSHPDFSFGGWRVVGSEVGGETRVELVEARVTGELLKSDGLHEVGERLVPMEAS